jgi:hypothetical protein
MTENQEKVTTTMNREGSSTEAERSCGRLPIEISAMILDETSWADLPALSGVSRGFRLATLGMMEGVLRQHYSKKHFAARYPETFEKLCKGQLANHVVRSFQALGQELCANCMQAWSGFIHPKGNRRICRECYKQDEFLLMPYHTFLRAQWLPWREVTFRNLIHHVDLPPDFWSATRQPGWPVRPPGMYICPADALKLVEELFADSSMPTRQRKAIYREYESVHDQKVSSKWNMLMRVGPSIDVIESFMTDSKPASPTRFIQQVFNQYRNSVSSYYYQRNVYSNTFSCYGNSVFPHMLKWHGSVLNLHRKFTFDCCQRVKELKR